MSGKASAGEQNRGRLPATTIGPGDFPLGSAQSRAAARAMLQMRSSQHLSQDDQDALTLYRGASLLHADMTPDYSDLEARAVYKRGRELALQQSKTQSRNIQRDNRTT